jgi:PAS domain S-box-containing protein
MERKVRNRLIAKKARLKKKNFIQLLEQGVKELQAENMLLRKHINTHCSVSADAMLKEEYKSTTTAVSLDSQLNTLRPRKKSDTIGDETDSTSEIETVIRTSDLVFLKTLKDSLVAFTITNPNLIDNPIIFCSDEFCTMTGYAKEEVLGRNCRFLQGPGTDRLAVQELRKNIVNGNHCVSCLLNYRKDGSSFWNYLSISPLKDRNGSIIMFVGVQYMVKDAVVGGTGEVVAKRAPQAKEGESGESSKSAAGTERSRRATKTSKS